MSNMRWNRLATQQTGKYVNEQDWKDRGHPGLCHHNGNHVRSLRHLGFVCSGDAVIAVFILLCIAAGFLSSVVLKWFLFEVKVFVRAGRVRKHRIALQDKETIEFFAGIADELRHKRFQITTWKG